MNEATATLDPSAGTCAVCGAALVRRGKKPPRVCGPVCYRALTRATKPAVGTCADCGAAFDMNQGRGRARKRCDPCRELARAGAW